MSSVYYWMAGMGVFSLLCLLFFFIQLRTDLSLTRKLKKEKKVVWVDWLYLVLAGGNIGLLVFCFLQVKAQLEIINF